MLRAPDHTQDWTLLLSTLLGHTSEESLPIQIVERTDTVEISSTQRALLTQLSLVLQSPVRIRQALAYRLNDSQPDEESADDLPAVPEYPTIVISEDPTSLFKHLFHPDVVARYGIFQWSELNQAEQAGNIIYFACRKEEVALTRHQFHLYKELLKRATLLDCMQALTTNESHQPLTFAICEQSVGALAENLSKIFYETQDKDGQTIFCFDLKLFLDCLTPPKLDLKLVSHSSEDTSDTQLDSETEQEPVFVCEVNKLHLISFLATQIQEGFMLHVQESPGNAEQRQGLPICFHMGRALPLQNIISFVLDCSYSMEEVFSEYQQAIIGFVQNLRARPDYQNTQIRITPFADQAEVTRVFDLNDSELIPYLQGLKANGNTFLNGAVAREMADLRPELDDKNVVLIVFTDGDDNRSPSDCLANLERQTSDIQRMSTPPKIFTYGLRTSSFNPEKLHQLANASGNEYTDLTNIRAFSTGLTQHLTEYNVPMRVMRFVQDEAQTAFAVRIREGEIMVAQHTLQIPGSATINGQPIYIDLQQPHLPTPPESDEEEESLGRGGEQIVDHPLADTRPAMLTQFVAQQQVAREQGQGAGAAEDADHHEEPKPKSWFERCIIQ